jgi:hypothetical protein
MPSHGIEQAKRIDLMGWFEYMSGENTRSHWQGDMSDTEWTGQAHHEASHARFGRSRRWNPLGIFVSDRGGLTGFADEDEAQASIEDQLMICRVGQEAEIEYLISQGFSRREAKKMTDGPAASDRQQFEQRARGTKYTWEGMEKDARKFVKRNAYEIEKTAKRLKKKGKDSGKWA